jgi:hypothetical protein
VNKVSKVGTGPSRLHCSQGLRCTSNRLRAVIGTSKFELNANIIFSAQLVFEIYNAASVSTEIAARMVAEMNSMYIHNFFLA